MTMFAMDTPSDCNYRLGWGFSDIRPHPSFS